MDRIEAMRVFVAAVEGGSLSAAGRQLRMPLPTVSRKLRELESHLKAPLLHRSTRALSLTDAGSAYLIACKRLLEDLKQAESAAAGEYSAPTGELIVTAPLVLGRLHLLPLVTQFLRAYPDVQVRLLLGDRPLNLHEDHIDLALRVGELPDSNLVASRVGMIRLVTCASAIYLNAHGAPRTPQDLARHDCVSFSGLVTDDAWHYAGARGALSVPVRPRLSVSTAEAALDAAIAGAGITRVMSYQAQAPVRSGALQLLLRKYEPAAVPVSLVYAARGRLPLKLRAFLDYTAPRLRAALAGKAAA